MLVQGKIALDVRILRATKACYKYPDLWMMEENPSPSSTSFLNLKGLTNGDEVNGDDERKMGAWTWPP
ncbi:hypothetical protein AYL99_11649 [Fonsecaea erecta]|uniref:Uncharacterized protein n=1 Tax=Fonsecaea erecta TaxID=1367422 RepID=A0A178Z333_9EURO|nr:hypothetical protein AYL99_11649 [Fonsecaea erecta]OAP54114.1 hypothetical protein AYL99_11649 [Fonsecaea erecta]